MLLTQLAAAAATAAAAAAAAAATTAVYSSVLPRAAARRLLSLLFSVFPPAFGGSSLSLSLSVLSTAEQCWRVGPSCHSHPGGGGCCSRGDPQRNTAASCVRKPPPPLPKRSPFDWGAQSGQTASGTVPALGYWFCVAFNSREEAGRRHCCYRRRRAPPERGSLCFALGSGACRGGRRKKKKESLSFGLRSDRASALSSSCGDRRRPSLHLPAVPCRVVSLAERSKTSKEEGERGGARERGLANEYYTYTCA